MTPIANREEWLKARLALLEKEKALTRLRDEIAAERRALPRVRVDKSYVFDAPGGKQSFSDLFGSKSQLLVYHFMFGPDAEQPCKICSFWAEHYDGVRAHLKQRDVEFVVVSRAPPAKLEAFRARMGWRFPWVSSHGTSFNEDFGVTFAAEQEGKPLYNYGSQNAMKGEMPGASAFVREGNDVFHSYSTYARGLDALNGTYQWLDLAPKGRDEAGLPWPASWVKFKDQYV